MPTLLTTLALLATADVPLPPPPPGMAQVATPPPAEAEDDGKGDHELDEVRALEEAAVDPDAQGEVALRAAILQLGYGSALRDRLGQALDDAEAAGDELPFVMEPVSNLEALDVAKLRERYDIPIEMRPLVAQYIRFYQGRGRKWFRRWMGRSSRYIPLMQPILEAKGLPRDTVYLAMIESGFNMEAKSWAAAVGPWQFIAPTAKLMGLRNDFWVDERRDPVKATVAAARYLSILYADLGHWYLAWAGYNTGGGRVRRMVDSYGTTDFWELCERRGFAKETKHYVPKLIAVALMAKHPEAFGFSPDEFEYEGPLEYDPAPLTQAIDVEVVARAAAVPVEQIKALNPELKRWLTPPATDEKPYLLRLPKGSGETFAQNIKTLGPKERLAYEVHKVVKGDTLSGIAHRYRSIPEAILRMNNLKSAKALRVNSELVVPVPSAKAVAQGKVDPALERQAAHARRSGLRVRPEEEVPAGTQSPKVLAASGSVKSEQVQGKTKVVYGVASGDTLWSIGQRFDVSVGDLRKWNEQLPKGRKGLKPGMALTVWPGPKAELAKN